MGIRKDIRGAIIDDILATGGGVTSSVIRVFVNSEFGTNYTTKQIYSMLSYISKMQNSPIVAYGGEKHTAWYSRY